MRNDVLVARVAYEARRGIGIVCVPMEINRIEVSVIWSSTAGWAAIS